jgi:cell division protein FtsB
MTSKIFRKLNNRYVWVALAFLVWIAFFDRYNLIYRFKIARDLNEAKDQKEYYEKEIEKDNQSIKELITDTTTLEKFAREKYLMKKDNEDIFLIIEEKVKED